jgi:hypothetical protein
MCTAADISQRARSEGGRGCTTDQDAIPALGPNFVAARLDQLWRCVPRTKPLSVGVVLLDLVPASHHQPDLFAADNHRRQKLSPLIDRINDRYGRCAIGFGLFPPEVRAFKGHAAFHRVPERWEL